MFSERRRRRPGGPLGSNLITSKASFPYFIDFVNNIVTGGTQPYGNNSNDGRFFRDSGVVNACFITQADNLSLTSTTAAGMRRSNKGTPGFQNIGTVGLWNRDLTQSAWTKTTMTVTKNQIGADGAANAASLLTASGASATALQTATLGSTNLVATPFVKRVTGTGSVFFTFDNVTFTDITALINSSTFSKLLVSQAAVTNPTWGFQLATSGDAITVDFVNPTSQIGSTNLDPMHYPAIVGSAFGSIFHEVPWALNTDAGPLKNIVTGPYAFYWQGYNYVQDVGGIIVSDGVTNCKLAATNAVQFSASVNLQSNNGDWNPGGALNKVAASLDAAGNMILGVNGHAYSRTGGILSPSATHFVLGNNGGATLPLNGWTEQFGIAANRKFTLATVAAITT